ncbi:VCBS repeat-containing protein [candidate division KSB1 bacterium]|nr:VCBS repeat-containing protein [candidate division KSB1 bacterium]
MKVRISMLLIVCLALPLTIHADLAYEVAWQLQGETGFAGPNAILDAKTGKTVGIVVAEVGTGIVCFSPEGKRTWEYKMTLPISAYPAVGDVDGDGNEDVVACDGAGNLVLLNQRGKVIWQAMLPAAMRAESCPSIGDLDGDGAPEILAGDIGGYVSCFDNKGNLRWRFRGDGSQMGPTLIADIYDAPGKEIIVTSHDCHIYALSARGEWLWDIYRKDDLFPNSTPLIADVDGNKIPELYVGGGLHHFYRIDLKQPRIVLEENVFLHVNSAICATDLNGDGRDEVIFGNKGGTAYCYDETGFAWKQQFPHSSMSHSPLVLNLDDDSELEIMFLFMSLQVIDTDGAILLDTKTPSSFNSPSLAGDFNGDGKLDVIAAGFGMFGNNSLVCMQWNVPYRATPNDWLVYTGNRAHTCRLPGAKSFPLLPTPGKAKKSSQAGVTPYGDMILLSGTNTWRFDVVNPQKARLALLTDLVYPDGTVLHFTNHALAETQRAILSFDAEIPGNYRMKQQLVQADDRTLVAFDESTYAFDGLASTKRYLNDVIFKQIEQDIAAWEKSNPRNANHARTELLGLRGQLIAIETATDQPETAFISNLVQSARRLRSLVAAGKSLAPEQSFFAWEFCPWAYFHPLETLPTPQDKTEKLNVSLCVGEYESLALNVTNISGRTLEIRVISGDLKGEKTIPADAHLQFRRAVTLANIQREEVADPLPNLDEARLLTVSSMETQQLWLTVNAIGLTPGEYTTELRLKSLEPYHSELILSLTIEVKDLALPRPRPLRFCVWSYVKDQPDYVLDDLTEHGVTVNFGTAPAATCDENGELVGELDFTNHDASVKRLAKYGILLFLSPQGALKGQKFLSPPWRKAFVEYMRQWSTHVKALGLGYEDWALYPYDEPSTPHSETTLNLVEVAKLVRKADPNILIYTDPTSGTTMETVEMFRGLIDIWCPSSELLERLADDLLPAAKRYGKHVWFYDAAGRSRTLSSLGIYRWRFWYAWNLGLTGVGWWTYAYGDHLWDGPNEMGDYFSTAYKAPHSMVSSKRWEMAREGIEDYEILFLLKNAIQRAKNEGFEGDALKQAEKLLKEIPPSIEATLFSAGRRVPLTPDGVPQYARITEVVQAAREKIIAACINLNKAMKR